MAATSKDRKMDTFKEKILDKLSEAYPSPRSELDFTNPLECLIATMLSAQCTDQRVNLVTKDLFDEFKSPEDYLVLDNHELEERIKSCNYYKTKSKHILETCKILHLKYNGEVPNTRSGLMELPGVGRKTANVVLSNAFGTPAIAVDTHVFRVANRLGIVKAENVTETEKQLMDAIPEEKWSDAHHWLILHGRRICKARKPLCEKCSVTNWCKYFKNQIMGDKV